MLGKRGRVPVEVAEGLLKHLILRAVDCGAITGTVDPSAVAAVGSS